MIKHTINKDKNDDYYHYGTIDFTTDNANFSLSFGMDRRIHIGDKYYEKNDLINKINNLENNNKSIFFCTMNGNIIFSSEEDIIKIYFKSSQTYHGFEMSITFQNKKKFIDELCNIINDIFSYSF